MKHEKKEKHSPAQKKAKNLNYYMKLGFLFLASYILLFMAQTVLPIYKWGFVSIFQFDFLFFFMPIPGFFMVYLMVDWINEYFETNAAKSLAFPAIFLALALLAEYVALYWFYGEIAKFSGAASPQFDFIDLLKGSAFSVFVAAGLLGWAARMVMDRTHK